MMAELVTSDTDNFKADLNEVIDILQTHGEKKLASRIKKHLETTEIEV